MGHLWFLPDHSWHGDFPCIGKGGSGDKPPGGYETRYIFLTQRFSPLGRYLQIAYLGPRSPTGMSSENIPFFLLEEDLPPPDAQRLSLNLTSPAPPSRTLYFPGRNDISFFPLGKGFPGTKYYSKRPRHSQASGFYRAIPPPRPRREREEPSWLTARDSHSGEGISFDLLPVPTGSGNFCSREGTLPVFLCVGMLVPSPFLATHRPLLATTSRDGFGRNNLRGGHGPSPLNPPFGGFSPLYPWPSCSAGNVFLCEIFFREDFC